MKYGVHLPNLGDCGDPFVLAGLAQEAESAGWDGVFIWDCIYVTSRSEPEPTCDPWIALAAMALRTERVRLGTFITPLSRRRPWKLARETVTLDHLSKGRLVLPVGLGTPTSGGFAKVGEETDRKIRAQRLDEGLQILNGLWSGTPFSYTGDHYQIKEMTFLPTPVQSPRIPIWTVGAWPRPKSMARVVRCDGILPEGVKADGTHYEVSPDDVREIKAYVAERRAATTPFDIVIQGHTSGDNPEESVAVVRPWIEAGATWFLEDVWANQDGLSGMRERIRQGPPGAD